jgi:hypothetical protein
VTTTLGVDTKTGLPHQVATGIAGFGLWVHHMFATGLPHVGASFFTAASIIIAIPTGTQIFCWLATIWSGKPRLSTSFLFIVGFLVIFVVGGLTGVMLASVPLDLQMHDTFFVVAHLHYVLIGGALFPLFAGLYHWTPKVTGRLLDERIGRWNFGLMFVGFNRHGRLPLHARVIRTPAAGDPPCKRTFTPRTCRKPRAREPRGRSPRPRASGWTPRSAAIKRMTPPTANGRCGSLARPHGSRRVAGRRPHE